MLAALAALGPPPMSGYAGAARDRLAAAGIVSPHADGMGAIEMHEVYWLDPDEGDCALLVGVASRDDGRTQPAILTLDHLSCGVVISDGLLMRPSAPEVTRRRLDELLAEATPPRPLSRTATISRLTDALDHMVDHPFDLPSDAFPPLALLERGLTGITGRWPAPGAGARRLRRIRTRPYDPTDPILAEPPWISPRPRRRERGARRKATRAARRRNRR